MQVFEFNEIESTQLRAKELSEEALLPFIVLANSQTKGKGTKGRVWYSPEGGFYFTLALELEFNLLKIDTVKFSQEACLLVVKILKDILVEFLGPVISGDLKIEPINDLYYKDAKLAGVLIESLNQNKRSILLTGIGLNINKLENQSLDRKIISLENILTKEDFNSFDKIAFAQKLASRLSKELLLIEKS